MANIEKNGNNDFHKYSYLMEADVKRAVNAAFREFGIVVVGTEFKLLNDKLDATLIHVRIHVQDAYSFEAAAFEGLGAGTDKGDKAVYKAIAGAVKYALTTGLLIAAGNDPEEDTETDRRAAAPKTSAPKTSGKPAAKEVEGPTVESVTALIADATSIDDLKKLRAVVSKLRGDKAAGAAELVKAYTARGQELTAG